MMKESLANLRKSASLILLCKDKALTRNLFDYTVLLFSRHEKASFMPKSSVFPGGVCEAADESLLWLKYFRNFGVQAEKLKELLPSQSPRPGIFATPSENSLQKEISLRITAIRETFEEVGIMLCRDRVALTDSSNCGLFRENFDRAHWQHLVHADPTKFLTLCQELDVIPDLWSLHEWSAWSTPSTFKKRFETAFFLVALQETPDIVLDKTEASDYAWKTPKDYLLTHLNSQLWLPPPQFYELSRLLNISKLDQVKEFAQRRATQGTTLLQPVLYQCTDGNVALLPGDDMYPADPNASNKLIPTQITMEKFRSGGQRLHRSEQTNLNKTILHLNFPLPHEHLTPMNVDLSNESKL